jgi:DNA polymerase (family X)
LGRHLIEQTPRQRFAAQLWTLADLIRASATRREFRSRAYRQAVWSLDDLSPELAEPFEGLLAVRAIGPGVAGLISEFREDGEIGELARLSAALPLEVNRLRVLPRMTPGRLRWLKAERDVESATDLIEVIRQGSLAELKGVGPETARTWLDRLDEMPPAGFSPPSAHQWAHRFLTHIESHVAGAKMIVTGSVRRLEEWVDAIDMVAAGAEGVIPFMEQSALVTGFSNVEGAVAFDTLGGPLNIYAGKEPGTTGPISATAVFATTGPGDHVDAVLRLLGDRAVLNRARSETDIYRAAGLQLVPPPARSANLDVPTDLIEVEDLRGDLHLHSDWSPDGRQTIEELVEAAKARGLDYIAITDHAKGLRFGGLDEERIAQQRAAIEQIRPRYPEIVILQGSELNIDRDGNVDFDDDVLGGLDFAIAAVHSFFTLNRNEQTRRVLNAIANPKIDVIAHLTGRRIGIRPPIKLDIEEILTAAVEHSTALEVNGHLDRMDVSAKIVARAAPLGALFAASSDAHRTHELSNVAHSVGILQRGGVTRDQVINTWGADELLNRARNRSRASTTGPKSKENPKSKEKF